MYINARKAVHLLIVAFCRCLYYKLAIVRSPRLACILVLNAWNNHGCNDYPKPNIEKPLRPLCPYSSVLDALLELQQSTDFIKDLTNNTFRHNTE